MHLLLKFMHGRFKFQKSEVTTARIEIRIGTGTEQAFQFGDHHFFVATRSVAEKKLLDGLRAVYEDMSYNVHSASCN